MRYPAYRIAISWAVLTALVQPIAGQHGISADGTVGTVSYSAFEGLSSSGVWQRLDDTPFWAIPMHPPDGYYGPADTSDASALRSTLHEIIDEHRIFKYTHPTVPTSASHEVDVWDIIAIADAHPEHPDRIIDLYHNNTLPRQGKGTQSDPRYDREHSWPKSLGFPDDKMKNAAYSDCHHLFAAYSSYNSSRSNKPYGTHAPDADKRKPTLENLGRGGSFNDEPDSSNYSFTDVWQTWIGRRGDVARAMFYMDVRYEGTQRSDGTFEADLQLTATPSDVTGRDVWETGGVAYMGLRSVLLTWHRQDPVDDLERRRNTVVYLFQGNRNPFIDHPEWVDIVFGDGTHVHAEGMQVWINELHYDNAGADENEFVEVAGAAGVDLDGWRLVGYNGSGGRAYKTVVLSGIIPAQQSGFGVVAFDFSSLQNGEPDGLALVNASGMVVQFISYEGHFTGGDGPADGVVSVNLGRSEAGNTPHGHSLQLTGRGRRYSAFTWTGPSQSSRGAINSGQEFPASD